MEKSNPILIIEDSIEDFEIVSWAFQKAGNQQSIERVARAEDALLRINQFDALKPCLILLDLNLPGMSGKELLTLIKQSDDGSFIPVVVLSNSNNPHDIKSCYRLGASGYICKPLQLQQFIDKIKNLMSYWFNTVALPLERN